MTALAVTSDDATAYSVSKDGSIFRTDIESGARQALLACLKRDVSSCDRPDLRDILVMNRSCQAMFVLHVSMEQVAS